MKLTDYQKDTLMGYMSACDHDDAPDGAWQGMLEDGAEMWAEEEGISIDTHEAFLMYVDYKSES